MQRRAYSWTLQLAALIVLRVKMLTYENYCKRNNTNCDSWRNRSIFHSWQTCLISSCSSFLSSLQNRLCDLTLKTDLKLFSQKPCLIDWSWNWIMDTEVMKQRQMGCRIATVILCVLLSLLSLNLRRQVWGFSTLTSFLLSYSHSCFTFQLKSSFIWHRLVAGIIPSC